MSGLAVVGHWGSVGTPVIHQTATIVVGAFIEQGADMMGEGMSWHESRLLLCKVSIRIKTYIGLIGRQDRLLLTWELLIQARLVGEWTAPHRIGSVEGRGLLLA